MVNELRQKFMCFQDPNFRFDPQWHKYTYSGKKYISVTTLLKNFHEPFDQDYWSEKKSQELGIPQEEILQEWKHKNMRANEIGTATHNFIENYFNRNFQTLPTDLDVIDRINKFNKIYATHLYKLEPVQFELRIFSKKWPLAGTIDSIFLWKDKLIIIDYKTNSDFKHDDHSRGCYKKLLEPFDDLWENHLNEYSLQVGLYSVILGEWGFDIKAGYLLHLGPETDAVIYKCQNLQQRLKSYLETYDWSSIIK